VSVVHVVVPDGLDDPARPSGGNVYDRRLCTGLAAAGWQVHEHPVAGSWPWPDDAAAAGLARVVAQLPDGALLLVDALVAATVPEVLVPAAARLRLVVLVHLPLGDGPPGHAVPDAHRREGAVLAAAQAVLTTSGWTRDRLLGRYGLPPERVHAALPGVDPAELAPGSTGGGGLLCVAAVTEHKGHDLLVSALTSLADLPWRCVCVGTLDREPELVGRLRRQAAAAGVADRLSWAGPRTGAELDEAYATADALVLASRGETYAMVVPEALAHGLPVVATEVGGLPEALGRTPDGRRPGLLVPPGDPRVLAAALRYWLTDAGVRGRLRAAAAQRRATLPGWASTTSTVARVLGEVAA
jgi:glycosyltransferase involved in cell wall biosynthesis